MAPDAAALSQPPHSGTRQDQDAESFGFEKGDLAALVTPPKFDSLDEERQYLKERIALACRIFAQYGLDHHIAGHLTVRVPGEPDSFYVNPFARSFSMMDAEDIITVSHTGDVIGGGKPGRRVVNKAGFLIHSSIHKARPDVQAICHSHSTYGKAWSTLGLPLEYTTQDSCAFYGRQSVLDSFGGVVLSKSEGARIAEKLGQGVLVVLQNHGLLTVGQTIDAAVARFILAEEQCRVSLLAHSAAQSLGTKVIQIADEEAKFTSNQGEEPISFFMASPYFQVAEHLWGEEVRAKKN
ncbi:class II aldolase/adducin domain containing protein [Rhodotorula toruloides]|uniref:Class II aldolase/adducin domain containing protein n=1 Tax=Rhodotorula toruloides TaxID=5286 RepID=A0A511KCM5_RHOTO|nr:class II aldolase/adducin domain containing protein [Rhodotorula toruloides]